MRLDEIASYDKPGTFAGVRFDEQTVNALNDFLQKNKIPNPVESDEWHTTLLYSRKPLPDYEPQEEYNPPMKGTPRSFEVWTSQPDKEGNTKSVLVLTFNCSKLYQRHHYLMNKHGATYDFDTYKPHVTFSYDVEEDYDVDKLPEFDVPLTIVGEYREDLKTRDGE